MINKSEAAILEQYRVALENAKIQSDISSKMAELSFDSTKIAEGEQLLTQTRQAYDFKKQEDSETTEASALFKKEKETLDNSYKSHRKKAKVAFRKTPETLKNLAVNGVVPKAYINWIETTRSFYSNTDPQIMQGLAPLQVTPEDISAGLAQIQKVEQARATYLREVGESQDATKQKDASFAKMDDWMRDFYDVANIALEEQPQLMEALSRKRKS